MKGYAQSSLSLSLSLSLSFSFSMQSLITFAFLKAHVTCFIVNTPFLLTPSVNASQNPPLSIKRQERPLGARHARDI